MNVKGKKKSICTNKSDPFRIIVNTLVGRKNHQMHLNQKAVFANNFFLKVQGMCSFMDILLHIVYIVIQIPQ